MQNAVYSLLAAAIFTAGISAGLGAARLGMKWERRTVLPDSKRGEPETAPTAPAKTDGPSLNADLLDEWLGGSSGGREE